MAAVGWDAVDGALVASEFSEWTQGVRVPEFENSSSTAAEQHGRRRHDPQSTNPVTMSVGYLL